MRGWRWIPIHLPFSPSSLFFTILQIFHLPSVLPYGLVSYHPLLTSINNALIPVICCNIILPFLCDPCWCWYIHTYVSALSKIRSKIGYIVAVVTLNSTCMHVSICMHLYRTLYSIARVLVYLIFLLLRSTYIIISLIPVLYFISDLLDELQPPLLSSSLIHNSNYDIRSIRSSFSASTVVIRTLSTHPPIHHPCLPPPLRHRLCRSSFPSRTAHAHKLSSGSTTSAPRPVASAHNGTVQALLP